MIATAADIGRKRKTHVFLCSTPDGIDDRDGPGHRFGVHCTGQCSTPDGIDDRDGAWTAVQWSSFPQRCSTPDGIDDRDGRTVL